MDSHVPKLSVKKLNHLANDEKSGVKVCRDCICTFQLKNKYVGNVISGVQNYLESTKHHYDLQWDGVVLDYQNIKILPPIFAQDKTLYDSTIAVNVSFDVYYLPFTISSVIRGVVTQVEDKHIGCLVQDIFHVSVFRPHNIPFAEWSGYSVNVGDAIDFRVTAKLLKEDIPSIHGELLENSLSSPTKKKKKKHKKSLSESESESISVKVHSED